MIVTAPAVAEYEHAVPGGRFRQAADTFVAEDGKVRGYVADDPAETVAVIVVNPGVVVTPVPAVST